MNIIQRFEKNMKGRDFVVGDIHGMFGLLKVKLLELGFNEETDRLFSVGDLIDRGPDSEEAGDWLATPWFHAVRGNHEQMAIDVVAGHWDSGNYLRNGGKWFFMLSEEEQKRYAAAFREMPYLIEIETDNGRVGIVHAEIDGDSWDDFSSAMSANLGELQETALWARSRIRHKEVHPIKDLSMLYVGHTPVDTPTRLGNVMYIDTGAVFGRVLTVVQIQGAYVGP